MFQNIEAIRCISTIVHALLAFVVMVKIVSHSSKSGFDPYGTGLRYHSFLDGANQGEGSNSYLMWKPSTEVAN